VAGALLPVMTQYIEAGRALPGPKVSACDNQDEWEREFLPLMKLYRPFGNFSELNFAQVGHGIGFYRAS
jgi:hypothetical protein